jgi:transcriptional regulator with XRE-family HTH domain
MNRGERIKLRREELGLSQAELARMLGKTRSLVSYIEKTGKVNDLTYYDILKKLELHPETEDEQFLVKRLLQVEEPKLYFRNENDIELMSVKRENQTLREMVELQKAVIEMLRKERR